MNIVILGPQASGKGTQAKLLARKLNYHYFEAGDILREIAKGKSQESRKVNQVINQKGSLVPSSVMKKIVANWLDQNMNNRGVIFDGYPRVKDQYQTLSKLLKKFGAKIDLVIFLKVSREVSLKRLLARRICPVCDAEYNLITKPPRKDELCDRCQKKLIRRQDDVRQIIEKRLAVFEKQTKPLVEYIRRQGCLEEVDGERSIKAIYQDILERISKY